MAPRDGREYSPEELWTKLREVQDQLSELGFKVDELLSYAREADSAVKGFLGGKNAKYLALLAKTKGHL
jgi:hypothetical protein